MKGNWRGMDLWIRVKGKRMKEGERSMHTCIEWKVEGKRERGRNDSFLPVKKSRLCCG